MICAECKEDCEVAGSRLDLRSMRRVCDKCYEEMVEAMEAKAEAMRDEV